MLKPTTSINYSSCHDNYTMYDQLMKTYKDNDKARMFQTFIMSNLFITQGIIFMNAGSEFFRTKLGEENSYNTSDEQNHIDWDKRDIEQKNIEIIKSLIKLRKSYKGYRLHTTSLIKKYTKVNVLKKGVIEYVITYDNNEYVHLINATNKSYHKTYDTEYIEIMKDSSIHLESVTRVNSIDVSPFTIHILKLK
jgi:pullulanase